MAAGLPGALSDSEGQEDGTPGSRARLQATLPPAYSLDGRPATKSPPNMGRKMHDSEDKKAKESCPEE